MAESRESIAVTLTEDDTPGAKLYEPWEQHTNHALRWLLLCHGIQVPVSLTKAKLIARFITESCWFYFGPLNPKLSARHHNAICKLS